MPNVEEDSDQSNNASARQLLEELERYAGWLGKGSRCARLRASVKQLAAAVATGAGTSTAMLSVQADIKAVGSSAITPLLRRTLQKLRAELHDPPL